MGEGSVCVAHGVEGIVAGDSDGCVADLLGEAERGCHSDHVSKAGESVDMGVESRGPHVEFAGHRRQAESVESLGVDQSK